MNRLLTQHVTLQCDFSITDFGHICTARNLNITSTNVTFIRVSTEYNYGVRNERVINLIISRQNLNYIPEGLSNFFKNLERLTIYKSNLLTLRFTDFIGLEHLEQIFIIGNSIQFIDERTFQSVPHLRILDLSDNKITAIPFQTFASSVELNILTLSRNMIRIFDIEPFPVGSGLRELRINRNRLERMNLASVMFARGLKVLDLEDNLCINLSYPFRKASLRQLWTEIVENCNEDFFE